MDHLNKKGVLFTLVSLVVSSFLILTFSGQTTVPLDSETETIRFRVGIIDRQAQTFESFSRDALRTSLYRSLIYMSDEVEENDAFFNSVDDVKSNLKQCMINATLNLAGEKHNCSAQNQRENITISYWLDELQNLSHSKMNLKLNYSIEEINVSQKFPFQINAKMTLNYSVGDFFAKVNRNVTVSTAVSIQGINEPMTLYYRDVDNEIYETHIEPSGWNKENLSNFTRSSDYRYHEDAPSLLMRYAGQLSNSTCCGIETVFSENVHSGVNKVENVSQIDHYYYDYLENVVRFNCSTVYDISTSPPPDPVPVLDGIRMDDKHLVNFNIQSENWTEQPGC